MPHHNSGRQLFGAPILLQDWDKEAEGEGAAQYWELFLDLALVAAASAVADQLLENQSAHGIQEFIVLFLIIINGFMLYSHHITTRFEDSSLAHSMVLFVYLLGFGLAIVNASFEDAPAFAVGALMQRVAILFMLGVIGYNLPRARYFCCVLSLVILLSTAGLCVTIFANETLAIGGLWEAALVEFLAEVVLSRCVEGRLLVPINIEQSKERLGAFELIMLGETVLSVTITYRELKTHGKVQDKTQYYWVLGLSFLYIFMFVLLFFHMQPTPCEHAFRRSRLHGTSIFLLHKVLGLFLLAGGVGIKLVVVAVISDEPLSVFASRLMAYSTSGALLTLLFMRMLHYAGKKDIVVGAHILRTGVNPTLDRLIKIWWWTVGVAWMIPIVGLWTGLTAEKPLVATSVYSGLLFVLCVVESAYTHILNSILAGEAEPKSDQATTLLEEEKSSSTAPTTYRSTII
jgi:low temperature requirement protein LtrA